MDSHLKQMIKEHNLKVIYKDIDKNGYIIKTPGNAPDLIFAKKSLSDAELEAVILHEIGHKKNDDQVIGDYSRDYSTRLCCEDAANNFMIHERVKKYVALGNEVSSSNYIDLAKDLGTQNYTEVKKELLKYLD